MMIKESEGIEIVWGSQSQGQEPLAEKFVELLRDMNSLEGTVYLSYPIAIQKDKTIKTIDAFLLLKKKPPILAYFDEGESIDTQQVEENLNDYFMTLESKLKQNKNLRSGRTLEVEIKTICYTFNTKGATSDDNDIFYIKDINSFEKLLDEDSFKIDKDLTKEIESTLQDITTIKTIGDDNDSNNNDFLYEKIKRVRNNIATFDRSQKKIAIETFNGVQRVRGLAGTGKTIILAWKAAYLHATNPEWKIAVTFHTRSLKEMYKKYITQFCLSLSGKFPNFEKLHIVNAWGGASDPKDEMGLYYKFCTENKIDALKFSFSKDRSFDSVCAKALESKNSSNIIPYYDLILIDEAQDLPISFLRMAYSFLKDRKRLVFAYDDWQSLNNTTLPTFSSIFGDGIRQTPDKFDRNPDLSLAVCYRTPMPILVVAHGLGCGIHRKGGFVQMLEPASYWQKLGYKSDSEIKKGKNVDLYRDNDSSPDYLYDSISSKENREDILDFSSFESKKDMYGKAFDKIKDYIKNKKIPPEEIMVIFSNYKRLFKNIELDTLKSNLVNKGIDYSTAGEGNVNIFRVDGNVTLTNIYRAKGNEASVVILLEAEFCEPAKNRNILFTAMTRTHNIIHVFGVGEEMQTLIKEKDKIVNDKFHLKFKYPTTEEIKQIRLVGDVDKKDEIITETDYDAEFAKLSQEKKKKALDSVNR